MANGTLGVAQAKHGFHQIKGRSTYLRWYLCPECKPTEWSVVEVAWLINVTVIGALKTFVYLTRSKRYSELGMYDESILETRGY